MLHVSERWRVHNISWIRIIVMAPQKNGTYAVRLHGRTGCVFIDKEPVGVLDESENFDGAG